METGTLFSRIWICVRLLIFFLHTFQSKNSNIIPYLRYVVIFNKLHLYYVSLLSLQWAAWSMPDFYCWWPFFSVAGTIKFMDKGISLSSLSLNRIFFLLCNMKATTKIRKIMSILQIQRIHTYLHRFLHPFSKISIQNVRQIFICHIFNVTQCILI